MLPLPIILLNVFDSMNKDFLTMTRRERRGFIVVLVLIALLLAGTAIVRSCRGHEMVGVVQAEVEQFEAEADSAATATVTPSRETRKTPAEAPRRSSRRKADKKSKPSPAPRPIDPVPQF